MNADTKVLVRVECLPHLTDSDFPIRLLVVDAEGGEVYTELKFTPETAREASGSVGALLGSLLSETHARRLAQGLRTAAVKVWASRN